MNKKIINFISAVSLLAFSLQLTSCSIMKPNHPQKKQSFKERRAPRDNMLAASGAFGIKDEDSTDFQPIIPSEVTNNKGPTIEPGTSSVTYKGDYSNTFQSYTQQLPSNSGSSSSSGGDFFKDMSNKLNSFFSSENNLEIQINPVDLKYASTTDNSFKIAQGDATSETSFYEMGEKISNNDISTYNTLDKDDTTSNTTSVDSVKPTETPSVAIPTIPSAQELRDESHQLEQPQLKDIPQNPTPKLTDPVKNEIRKSKDNLPTDETMDPVAKNPYKDNIHEINGKKIVTGFLNSK